MMICFLGFNRVREETNKNFEQKKWLFLDNTEYLLSFKIMKTSGCACVALATGVPELPFQSAAIGA
jgi:hypothetical protein